MKVYLRTPQLRAGDGSAPASASPESVSVWPAGAVQAPTPAAAIPAPSGGSQEHEPRILQHTLGALTARGSMLVARGLGLVFISRQLGGAQFGVYSLLLVTYNVMLSIGAFGLEQANLYLAGRRPGRARALAGNSLALGGVLGVAAGLLFLSTVALLHRRIFAGASSGEIWLCALALPVAVTHNALAGIVVGLGRFRYYGTLEGLKWAAYVAAVGTLYGRHALGLASSLGCFFAVLLLAAVAHAIAIGVFTRGLPRLDARLLRPTLRLGRNMLFVHLTAVLGLRLDVYAVRIFGTTAQVGHYALASNLSEILLYVARAFSLVVFSGAARRGRTPAPRLRGLAQWILVSTVLLCTALLVTRQELLRLVFGETFEGSLGSLFWRLPGVLTAAVGLLLTGELLGRGSSSDVVRGNLLGVSVLAVLAWPLAQWNVTEGAAAAFTLAALAQFTWMAWILRRRGSLVAWDGEVQQARQGGFGE